ncbi:MAG: hypothetical protein AB7Q17_09465 [Phycisphaerae bacterium]
MDTFRWLLLESPAALGTLLGLVNFGLLVHWRRGGRARPLVIALATTTLLLGMQAAIVTQREAAAAWLTRIERDLRRGRAAVLEEALAPGFRAGTMNGEDFVAQVRDQLRRLAILTVYRAGLQIEPRAADCFVAHAAYLAELKLDSQFSGFVRSRWQITFIRTPAGWRIETIEPPEIENTKFEDWSRVWR